MSDYMIVLGWGCVVVALLLQAMLASNARRREKERREREIEQAHKNDWMKKVVEVRG